MPIGRDGGVNRGPQFRLHQETKVAASRTQRSTSRTMECFLSFPDDAVER